MPRAVGQIHVELVMVIVRAFLLHLSGARWLRWMSLWASPSPHVGVLDFYADFKYFQTLWG